MGKRNKRLIFFYDVRRNESERIALLTSFGSSLAVCTCSVSGKLTASLMNCWRDNVLAPCLLENSKYLLLSDAWSTLEAKSLYESLKNLERLEIPPKITSLIQPSNVYFNRQRKAIARRAYDRVRLDDININMSERNNILRLQSLIHNQMSSPIFVPMITYAWYASGYSKTSKKCAFPSTATTAANNHVINRLSPRAVGVMI